MLSSVCSTEGNVEKKDKPLRSSRRLIGKMEFSHVRSLQPTLALVTRIWGWGVGVGGMGHSEGEGFAREVSLWTGLKGRRGVLAE